MIDQSSVSQSIDQIHFLRITLQVVAGGVPPKPILVDSNSKQEN